MKFTLRKAVLAIAAAACSFSTFAVVNDITLKNVTPKAGELDIELRSLEQITLTFSQDVNVRPNTLAYLTTPDGQELTSVMERNQYLKNTVLLSFPEITYYAGSYTLTIKKWSVGDDTWLEDYQLGHSNPEIQVEWTVANGLSKDVSYDLQPVSILPANNSSFSYPSQPLTAIQITMPAGTIMSADAEASLSCVEARYNQPLTFEAEEKGNNIVYTANVSPSPFVRGDYTLTFPAGMFGDSEFFEEGKGHANPNISLIYSVDLSDPDATGDEENVNWDITPSRVKIEGNNRNYTLTWSWPSGITTDNETLSNWRILDNHGYRVQDVTFSFINEAQPTDGVKFTADLTPSDKYTLLIPEGYFYDRTYADSNHLEGSANAQLRYDFIPQDISSGITAPEAGDKSPNRSVYTSQGIRLYDNATEDQLRTLPAGLYIIAGKKVLVK